MALTPVDMRSRVEDFFRRYAARFNDYLQNETLNVEEVAGAFADCFVESSPVGVNCGQNDDQFRAMIPQGFLFYRSIGTTAMNITRIDMTPLNDLHMLAKVYWDSRYSPKDRAEQRIEFENLYFLTFARGEPKIFAYITGDEQKILQERGLVPG